MRNLILTVAASALIFGASSANLKAQSVVQSQSSATARSEDQLRRAQSGSTATDEAAITTSFASQSATGKITAVSGETFAIEVGDGGSKETMQFVTDSNTAKSGDLKVGSSAIIQYHSGTDGKNTATKVDIQG